MKSSKLSTLLCSYILLVCVWFFLWLKIGDGPWWLTVLNRVVPYLFLPVFLFLPGLVRTRQYRFTALLILPISIFSFLFHPHVLPKFSTRDASSANLSVMTYNILYNNYEYDAIANIILTHRPDLVALQEVLPETMSELEDRLADEYPYSIHGTYKDYAVTALFSRYPLAETDVLDLGEDRRAVIIKTEVNDQSIIFAAVHLRAYGLQWVRPLINVPQEIVARTNTQNGQVEILLDELQDESGMVIIGCDCNSKETSSSYRMLDKWFENAAYEVGWQIDGNDLVGAKQDRDLERIDFVWYHGTLEPLGVYEVKDSGGSDHHPILALFELR